MTERNVSAPEPATITSDRAAVWTFGAAELAVFFLWLYVGRSRWFFNDEWDFIATRKAGSLGDLFRPHNGHWSTLPILAYRLLWWLFGLRAYLPYLVCVVVLHLAAAALLRVVMRRAGVNAWIATATATLFALFGAGHENVLDPFQIGFSGSLVFGLTHLVLADHDGHWNRRDVLGLAAGCAGMLCSGVAVTMVVVVAIAVFLRRGWRIALLHTLPLGGAYLLWWSTIARTAPNNYTTPTGKPRDVVRFVATGLRAAYTSIGQLPGLGPVIFGVLVVGLVVVGLELRSRRPVGHLAAPIALLVGSVVFLSIVGAGRVAFFGPNVARASRYMHIVVAISLPAIALAADALARRSRYLAPLLVALFLIGVPGNVRTAADFERDARTFTRAYRQTILSIPRLPLARRVPGEVRPDPVLAPDLSVGWLLGVQRSGRLPAPARISAAQAASNTFRLSLLQSRTPSSSTSCRSLEAPLIVVLHRGQSIGISGIIIAAAPTDVALLPRDEAFSFRPSFGSSLVAVVDTVSMRLQAPAFVPTRVCLPAP